MVVGLVRIAAAAAAFGVFGLASSNARADVEWPSVVGCPSAEAVRARVRALAPTNEREPTVIVTIHDEGVLTVAEVRIDFSTGETGTRRLEGEDCASVAEAACLVIAMSLRESASAPSVPPALEVLPRRAASSSESSHVRGTLALEAGVVAGPLPNASPSGALVAAASLGAFRVEVEGSLVATQRGEAAPGLGGDFSLFSAAARGCFAPRWHRITVGTCVGLEVDHMTATGVGALSVSKRVVADVGPQLGGILEWRMFGALGLRAEVVATAPVVRRTFVLGAVGEVHRPGVMTVGAWIGPQVTF